MAVEWTPFAEHQVHEVTVRVGEDFVSVQVDLPTQVWEVLRFHSVEGAYRFFHDGIQAILVEHPHLEEKQFDIGDFDDGTFGLPGGSVGT